MTVPPMMSVGEIPVKGADTWAVSTTEEEVFTAASAGAGASAKRAGATISTASRISQSILLSQRIFMFFLSAQPWKRLERAVMKIR